MNAQTRLIPATGGATAATFGIFFMMQGLAQTDLPNVAEPTLRPIPEIFFNPPPPPPPRAIDRVQRPEFVSPPVEDKLPSRPDNIEPDIIIGPPKAPPTTPAPRMGTLGLSDGHMIPIARVTPTYPRAAASRGIEGWVQLSFTVTRHGTVENAVVIAAEPNGVFDSAALNAIRKFRYKPTVINGAAQDTPNVQIKLTFNLQE